MPEKSSKFESPLKVRREQLRLTQKDLAEALGTTVQTVSNWETGRFKEIKLTPTQTKKLCNMLDWTIETLPEQLGPLEELQEADLV